MVEHIREFKKETERRRKDPKKKYKELYEGENNKVVPENSV
jgi:hypothetical protein